MKDIATKTNGVSTYSAEEFNPNMTELENAVLKSGQTLNELNLDQLGEAMGRYGAGGADYYVDSGIANAYVLTGPSNFIQSKTYFHGMRILFTAGSSNTGPSTINVNTIGSVDLKDATGKALGKDYIRFGDTFTAIYNGSEFRIIATGRTIPFGFIGLFAGLIAYIPAGWALCDGENGTPDLRNFFVRGAGSTFSVGQTGGSENTGSHILTIAEMPPHTHSQTFGVAGVKTNGDNEKALPSADGTTGSTGGNAGHTHPDTVPPFYALAFIMKL